MRESVAVAKEADKKKEFSSTKSSTKGSSIHRLRDAAGGQLGSLGGVIGNIRRDGGTLSADSIAMQLSGMHTGERAPALLALQQTHGNRYVQRVVAGIQAKLVVGQPGDIYEQEADRVADEVMRMPDPRVQRQVEPEGGEEILQAKPLAEEITPLVQRQVEPEEKEEPLQAKFASGLTGTLLAKTEASQNRTGMPDNLKSGLENLSSMDLSSVRVHHNSSEPAQLNALAYTQGQDIHLGPGQEKHLPHEGWHVVQQMQGRVNPTMQVKGVSINDDAGLEREAYVMGAKALQMKEAEQATTGSAHQGSTSFQREVGTTGESEVLGKAIGTSGEKVRLNFLSTQQNSSTDLSHTGKDAKKVSSLSSVYKKDKVIQRVLPAVFVKYAGEWIAASAIGFAAADHIAGSTEGDIKYTFAELKGVLLPGGGTDVASYRKKNPKRPIFKARQDLAVWYGFSGWKKMGIKFSIYFNYDGKALGNIDMGIIKRYDSLGWAGNIDMSLTALSLAGGVGSVRIITNLITHNSWFIPDHAGHSVFTLSANGDLKHTGQGGGKPFEKIG